MNSRGEEYIIYRIEQEQAFLLESLSDMGVDVVRCSGCNKITQGYEKRRKGDSWGLFCPSCLNEDATRTSI